MGNMWGPFLWSQKTLVLTLPRCVPIGKVVSMRMHLCTRLLTQHHTQNASMHCPCCCQRAPSRSVLPAEAWVGCTPLAPHSHTQPLMRSAALMPLMPSCTHHRERITGATPLVRLAHLDSHLLAHASRTRCSATRVFWSSRRQWPPWKAAKVAHQPLKHTQGAAAVALPEAGPPPPRLRRPCERAAAPRRHHPCAAPLRCLQQQRALRRL